MGVYHTQGRCVNLPENSNFLSRLALCLQGGF